MDSEPYAGIIIVLHVYLEHLPGGAEWQHGHADQQIGHGQRHNERVSRRPQFGAVEHGGYDKRVADGHDERDERQAS